MSSLLEQVRTNQKSLKTEVISLLDTATRAGRPLSDHEERTLTAKEAELRAFDNRIDELIGGGDREAAASTAAGYRSSFGVGTGNSVTEAATYMDPNLRPQGPSFMRDLYRSQNLGDRDAQDRVDRHKREIDAPKLEIRALGNTGGAGGSGGEMAPPAWLVDEYVKLARPGRVTADLMSKRTMLSGVSSINLPKVLTGTSIAPQTTQNTALSSTDLTTGFVSSPIKTYGGKQVVSQQLLDQSPIPFDRMILGDLAAAHSTSLDKDVINADGTGGTVRGLYNGVGVGNTTYTTATPKFVDGTTPANSFYNKIIAAINAIYTSRLAAPTAIIMHPARWGWALEALDASSRPLILSQGVAFNPVGLDSANVPEGATGILCGLPVYLDPNIPVNKGTGTNQDTVIVAKTDDAELFESPLVMETFREPYADSMGVLFRAYSYSAFIPDRYGPSVNLINGTGLVAPVL